MAEPVYVDVDLAAFLSDLPARAMKGLVPAPIGYRADRLLEVLHDKAHPLWPVSHGDLVAALLHATPPNIATLRPLIETYRDARVWETRRDLGEESEEAGSWSVPMRARGQKQR